MPTNMTEIESLHESTPLQMCSYTCRRLIMATPPQQNAAIVFRPPLPEYRHQLNQNYPPGKDYPNKQKPSNPKIYLLYLCRHSLFPTSHSILSGNLLKFIVTYRKSYWREKGLSGEIVSSGGTQDKEVGSSKRCLSKRVIDRIPHVDLCL